MFRKSLIVLLILVCGVLGVSSFALAQDDVVASDLINPRGMAFDAEGNLYVVEAGNPSPDVMAEGPFGPTAVTTGGRLSMIAPDGTKTVIVESLIGINEGDTYGAQAVHVTDTSIWLLLGQGPMTYPLTMGLVELDKTSHRMLRFVDLYTSAATQRPVDDPSNPTDFTVADDGTVFIANASCNCIQRWKNGEGTSIFASWGDDENPVPTTIQLGIDGFLYVSFLTGWPFPEGTSRVEIWSTEGELVDTIGGLTAVTDVLVDENGTIYAVEHGVLGDAGWGPGRVVTVSADGITPVLENLTRPWGLARDASGNMVVSVGSAGGQGGQVMRVPAM